MISDSDLVIVRAEPAPRSAATCKRVAAHAGSRARLIGAAIAWLLVAWVAWSIPLFLALLFLPGPWTPPQAAVVLGSTGVTFALAWVGFILLMLRRRRERRRLVRDGVLVDGVIIERPPGWFRRPIVRFAVDGIERRILVRIDANQKDDAVPILVRPGGRHVLAFAGRTGGRARVATVHRDVVVDRTSHRATVTLTRGVYESVFIVLLGLSALELPLLFVAATMVPPNRLTCDRGHDACEVDSFDIFGRVSTSSFRVSDLTGSVVRETNGERQWIAERKTGTAIELTGTTGDAKQAETFDACSRALADFIAEPARRTLTLEYRSSGRPPLPVLIIISTGALLLVFRWAHGLRTTLTIDRGTGTFTIHRRPALIPPATRTLPLASIARADVRTRSTYMVNTVLQTLMLTVRDREGKIVFARWQLASRTAQYEDDTLSELLTQRDCV